MIGHEVVRERHQKTCVTGNGHLCLLVGEDQDREFASAKIIGPSDNPHDWLAVFQDVGRSVQAMVELPTIRQHINLTVLEGLMVKEINHLIKHLQVSPNTGPESGQTLTTGEKALRKILLGTGEMQCFIACLNQAIPQAA